MGSLAETPSTQRVHFDRIHRIFRIRIKLIAKKLIADSEEGRREPRTLSHTPVK